MRMTDEQGNETMTQLNAMSNEITGILSMISEIADKTNLLALNMVYQSGGGGEQGRSFAVVAVIGVRSLAQTVRNPPQSIQSFNQLVAATASKHPSQMAEQLQSMAASFKT